MAKKQALIGDDELPDVEEAPPPSDADLKSVADLARNQIVLLKQIVKLETELAQLQAAYKQNVEVDLPTKLKELGVTTFGLKGGHTIVSKEMVMASIPKGKEAEAHEFIEAAGDGGIIKHRIQILFDRGEEAWAKKFMADCAKRKKPLLLDRKDWIEPQTLGAYVREKIAQARAAGADPETVAPTKLLGVYKIDTAKVEGPSVPTRVKKERK